MPFDRPKIDTIYNRMKADAEQRLENTNWFSRSLVLILIAVFAGAIYLCYGFLVRLSKQLFFTTADEEFVEWHARKYGLPRKPAEFATGQVRFFGVDTTLIPEGTEIETEDGTIYETDEDVYISGPDVEVGITAVIAGTSGNTSVTTMTLVTPIIDINSTVQVIESPDGGIDQETIPELVARLLQRTQNPPGSGNVGDYERWALEVSGVGRAFILDSNNWAGAGTVGVIIASASLEVVSAAIKTNVENYIDTKRPIGADVDVEDIIPKNCDFEIDITPNTTEFQNLIDEALEEIFILESEPGGTMLISQINQAIGSTGINDYSITAITVDGVPIAVGNIEQTGLNTSRFGSAIYSDLT